MKKLLFFIIPFLFIINVHALDVDVTDTITSPNSPTQGRYSATEIYNTGTDNVYNVKTRYSGKLSRIRFNLPLPSTLGQCFSTNVSYTVTLNMASSDWRNKFGEVSASAYNHNFALGGVPTFVSMKKIYFNVKLPTSVDYCVDYLFVDIQSTNISTTAFTGESNWQLQSVILTDPTYSSGGGGGSSPTPTPYIDLSPIVDSQNKNTQDIISNNNQNTNTIIENNNQNTQDIVSGLTDIGQHVLDSSQQIINNNNNNLNSCHTSYNLFDISLLPDTAIRYNNGFTLKKDTNRTLSIALPSTLEAGTYTLSFDKITTPNYTYYVKLILGTPYTEQLNLTLTNLDHITFTSPGSFNSLYFYIYSNESSDAIVTLDNLMLVRGSSVIPFEAYGQNICVNKIDETNNAINDLTDTMKDDNIDDNSSFFSDFETNNHGLTGIITAPLTTIQNLSNNSCVALTIPIPFTNDNISLPCMHDIYLSVLGGELYTLIRAVITGIISYYICLDIFRMVKGFKDPQEDKIEVLDL